MNMAYVKIVQLVDIQGRREEDACQSHAIRSRFQIMNIHDIGKPSSRKSKPSLLRRRIKNTSIAKTHQYAALVPEIISQTPIKSSACQSIASLVKFKQQQARALNVRPIPTQMLRLVESASNLKAQTLPLRVKEIVKRKIMNLSMKMEFVKNA